MIVWPGPPHMQICMILETVNWEPEAGCLATRGYQPIACRLVEKRYSCIYIPKELCSCCCVFSETRDPAGRWKLDPKRSREKCNLRPKRSNFVRIGSSNTPKDSFRVGGWEKVPQEDRVQSPECQKRGSKRRHIHITQHRGSTLPGMPRHVAQCAKFYNDLYDRIHPMRAKRNPSNLNCDGKSFVKWATATLPNGHVTKR